MRLLVPQLEDESGGIGKRRQGQLLCHDQVYPIRSPGLFSFFSSLFPCFPGKDKMFDFYL